jgi:hypothetical protein
MNTKGYGIRSVTVLSLREKLPRPAFFPRKLGGRSLLLPPPFHHASKSNRPATRPRDLLVAVGSGWALACTLSFILLPSIFRKPCGIDAIRRVGIHIAIHIQRGGFYLGPCRQEVRLGN